MTKPSKPWGYVAPSATKSKRALRPQTVAVRGELTRTGFGETSEALFLNSGFTYPTAEAAEGAFAQTEEHHVYSRYSNPTVQMFEQRLALMEGAEAAIATGTGMAAMFTSVAAVVSQGDRVVISRAMFTSCFVVLTEFIPRWGIEVVVVDENTEEAWAKALVEKTKLVFIETPSNPLLEVIDISMIADLAHKAGAMLIVDNVMATGLLQRPLELGADAVMYSATKHIDGQGRVLGGAILGSHQYINETVRLFARHTGPTMSPFNAWVLLKSLETYELRVNQMTQSAHFIAEKLEASKGIKRVLYPHLESHPDFELAKRQMSAGGTTVAIELDGSKQDAYKLINSLEVIDISNNLGDSRSLITHPATTTHYRLDAATRTKLGISDSTLRLSVGLEDPEDLLEDLLLALQS
uniref:O-succinylhomoserine sulfhydrylase n=1 Tax=Aquiluna sp. TaxID=2053504 RepID=UPI004047086E